MDNKKFIIIFAILVLIIIGLVVYSLIFTIKNNNEEKNINISMDEFNDVILSSNNFNTSKVSDITFEDLKDVFGIESENIISFFGKKSVLNTDACLYLLIEPKDGMQNEVYENLEKFCISYEESWSNYLESQYDIVVDRKIGKINNYIYLIISDDAYDIIKELNFVK